MLLALSFAGGVISDVVAGHLDIGLAVALVALLTVAALMIALQLRLSWSETRQDDSARLAHAVWEQENATLDQLVRHPLIRYGRDDSARPLPVEWADWSPTGLGPQRQSDLDELTRHRRLVILGDAGAGKSVLAMRVSQLLADRALSVTDQKVAFPVRAGLADFPEGTVQRFDDWLVSRIVQAGVPRADARTLVEQGRIVAVLDGLDETDAAATVIDALNRARPRGRCPVVLTCETRAYDQLVRAGVRANLRPTWLVDAHAVELLPLEPATVIAEIERRFAGELEPWEPVLGRLRKAEPGDRLVSLLRSPQYLSLLISLGPEASEDEIFERYIEAVAQRHGGGRYTARQVRRWLTVIAHAGGAFHVTDLWRVVVPWLVRAVTIVLGWLIAIIVAGELAAPLVVSHFPGNAGAVQVVLVLLVFAGLMPMYPRRSAPRVDLRPLGRSRTWVRVARTVARASLIGAGLGAFAGLVTALLRQEPRVTGVVAVNTVLYAGAGAILGLAGGLDLDPPARSRRRLVAQGLTCAAMVLVLSAIAGALFWALLVFRRPDLIAMGAALGLLAGLGLVGMTIWPTYVVACLVHAVLPGSPLPARPAAFVDWAHRAGLLRPTGNDDQFRSQALLAWLSRNP